MLQPIVWTIFVLTLSGCLFFWFRDVRQLMRSRRSTVESAAGQLTICRKKSDAADDPAAKAVLKRSESIYRQAVYLYEKTRKKPWVYLPALLMGFHAIGKHL